jgi:hypothetical protein
MDNAHPNPATLLFSAFDSPIDENTREISPSITPTKYIRENNTLSTPNATEE